MKIPSLMLRQLYTFGSLRNLEGGFGFTLKNRLSDATVTAVLRLPAVVRIHHAMADGIALVPIIFSLVDELNPS